MLLSELVHDVKEKTNGTKRTTTLKKYMSFVSSLSSFVFSLTPSKADLKAHHCPEKANKDLLFSPKRSPFALSNVHQHLCPAQQHPKNTTRQMKLCSFVVEANAATSRDLFLPAVLHIRSSCQHHPIVSQALGKAAQRTAVGETGKPCEAPRVKLHFSRGSFLMILYVSTN